MTDRVLILAAGKYEGWKGAGGRHLLSIEGVPLIRRTLTLLSHRRMNGIVVTLNPELIEACHRTYQPADDEFLLSTFLSTRELWADKGRMVILMGDVVWSNWSLDSVLECKADLMFHLGYPAGVLALTFCPVWHNTLVTVAGHLLKDPRLAQTKSKRRLMGHLHRSVCGFDVMDSTSPRDKKSPHHRMITGSCTRDIDSLEDYHEFLEDNPWAKDSY